MYVSETSFLYVILIKFNLDQDFLKVFSMTYRSFMDAEMVMELVIKRFKGPDPETLNDEEKEKLET